MFNMSPRACAALLLCCAIDTAHCVLLTKYVYPVCSTTTRPAPYTGWISTNGTTIPYVFAPQSTSSTNPDAEASADTNSIDSTSTGSGLVSSSSGQPSRLPETIVQSSGVRPTSTDGEATLVSQPSEEITPEASIPADTTTALDTTDTGETSALSLSLSQPSNPQIPPVSTSVNGALETTTPPTAISSSTSRIVNLQNSAAPNMPIGLSSLTAESSTSDTSSSLPQTSSAQSPTATTSFTISSTALSASSRVATDSTSVRASSLDLSQTTILQAGASSSTKTSLTVSGVRPSNSQALQGSVPLYAGSVTLTALPDVATVTSSEASSSPSPSASLPTTIPTSSTGSLSAALTPPAGFTDMTTTFMEVLSSNSASSTTSASFTSSELPPFVTRYAISGGNVSTTVIGGTTSSYSLNGETSTAVSGGITTTYTTGSSTKTYVERLMTPPSVAEAVIGPCPDF